jgi:hypothetical protein
MFVMLIGKRFRLNEGTLAVTQPSQGHRATVTIPSGEILKAVSAPSRDGLVDVLWNSRVFDMFQVDLESRGEELPEASGAHS